MNKFDQLQDSLVFSLFAAGLIFMLGVIHYQGTIDSFFQPQHEIVMGSPKLPSEVLVSDLPESEQYYIQSILNDPANIYQAQTDKPTPAQAILEDRGTKFLMGM